MVLTPTINKEATILLDFAIQTDRKIKSTLWNSSSSKEDNINVIRKPILK